MKFFIIYQVTNLCNNQYYIGSHITTDINDSYLGSGKLIKRAVKKYGKANFTKEILCYAVDELSMEWLERAAVIIHDEDPMSYNIVPGGGRPPVGSHNIPHTEASKRLMSVKRKGVSNPHTKEQNIKIGLSGRGKHNQSGSLNPNFGRKHTPESIEKMRLSKLGNQNWKHRK